MTRATFWACALLAGLGMIASMVEDGGLRKLTEHGIPHTIPALGSAVLLLAAYAMWSRADDWADAGDYLRALAAAVAVGAGCAGLRPICLLLGSSWWGKAAEGAQWVLAAALLLIALPRLVRASWLLMSSQRRRQVRVAAALVGCSALSVYVALLVPEATWEAHGESIAWAVYALAAGSVFALLSDWRRPVSRVA